MYEIYDTFNGQVISRHRTREKAEEVNRKFQKAVKKANGPRSYIPVQLREVQ